MENSDRLLPKHGGYKNLLTYQLTELIFDITVHFCKRYVPYRDRTNDQMVQSGRSGFQNIAEGSVDSGVSKKSELKLTGISIGCQDELAKDYKKYLEGKSLDEWPPTHPALQELKERKVKSLASFRTWVKDVWQASEQTLPLDQIAANGALSLLNLSMYLTRRQLASQEKAFLEEGGVTERLYRLRKQARERKS
jgi:four helix bundle suffix protein